MIKGKGTPITLLPAGSILLALSVVALALTALAAPAGAQPLGCCQIISFGTCSDNIDSADCDIIISEFGGTFVPDGTCDPTSGICTTRTAAPAMSKTLLVVLTGVLALLGAGGLTQLRSRRAPQSRPG
jgi:hypothetical protein